jgi:nucleotide-binding universal stress UspA family protein
MGTLAAKSEPRLLAPRPRAEPDPGKPVRRARKMRVAMRDDVGRTPRPVRRILVCVDFSPAADTALTGVLAAAAGRAMLIELVYVVDVFTEMFVLGNMRPPRGPDVAGRDIHAALSARVQAARAQGARCISTILVGLPGLALLNHADRTDADLLVLGLEDPAGAPRGGDRGSDHRGRRPRKAPRSGWLAPAAQRVLRTPGWRRATGGPAFSPELPIVREIS